MGQAASKTQSTVREARSKPKNNRKVQRQKIATAAASGVLALQHRKLTKVPDDVLELTKLRSLDLSDNRLSEVPAEVNALVALKTLKLPRNALSTLPDMGQMQALTTLVLDGNVITTLPNALPPRLTKLSLRENRLSALPQTITSLVALRELDVSQNQLSELPTHIAELGALVELHVDGNRLTTLPAAVARCAQLKVLAVRHNRLAKTPNQCIAVEILAESNIVMLHLEGNALTKQDLEAMEGIDAFLERRTHHKNKELHGGLNTDTSLCGLD